MWIIKPEEPEWKRTLKNLNPNALMAVTFGIIGFYVLITILKNII